MTRLLLVPLLALLACNAPEPEPKPAPQPQEAPMKIEASYEGWAWQRSGPDPQPFAIRDRAAYDAFLGRIPEHVPSKKQPAPKNDDALRDAPAPDFSTHMLVVATRDSMYVGPQLTEVERAEGKLRVRVEHPPLGDTIHAAALMDLGRYCAVLVPRFDGELEAELIGVEERGPNLGPR